MNQRQPLKKILAGLEVYEVEGEKDAPCVILFHGFGADAKDLIPLSQAGFGCRVKPTFIFPNGPLEVPLAPGYVGKGWFPIDINLLKEAIQEKNSEKVIAAFPKDYSQTRAICKNLIAELDIPLPKIFVGGFSQGAIVATDIALNSFNTMAALIIFSGLLVNREEWEREASRHQGLHFFQSHGKDDPLIPYEEGEKLEQFFKTHGFKGHMSSFQGGHEIPYPIIIKFNAFLRELVK